MSKVTSLFIFADSFVSEVSFVIYQSVQHKYNLKLCWITANAFRISDCNLYVNRDRQAEQNYLLKGTKMFRFNSKSRGFDEYWSMEGGKVLMNESLPLDGQKKKHFHEGLRGSYKSKLSIVWSDSRFFPGRKWCASCTNVPSRSSVSFPTYQTFSYQPRHYYY